MSENKAIDASADETSVSLDGDKIESDFFQDKVDTLKLKASTGTVPFLPGQELEYLLTASIDLCKKKMDLQSKACQNFFQEGLKISFEKMLTNDSILSEKSQVHCVYTHCQRLIELCVLKLEEDCSSLFGILELVFDPNIKFHLNNSVKPSTKSFSEDEIYAISPLENPRSWLVNLINGFGTLRGFDILLERFENKRNLSVSEIHALMKPFGNCHKYLTLKTINKYFIPIVKMIPEILEDLTSSVSKEETKVEPKNDEISAIIKVIKNLVSRSPEQEEIIKNLEILSLKMIQLLLLKNSTFHDQFNALDEVKKMIDIANICVEKTKNGRNTEDSE